MKNLYGNSLINNKAIKQLRDFIGDEFFVSRHRCCSKDFTRHRVLGFAEVMLLIIQKTLKSLQLHLHEFLERLADGQPWNSVSASAWTQARAKLRHTAFIELNEQAIANNFYGKENESYLNHWQGHRLLAIDSSVILLPQSSEIEEEFMVIDFGNQHGESGQSYPQARVSILYDVLNRISLEGVLRDIRQGERQIAQDHLKHLQPADVVLVDRGYPSFEFFSEILKHGSHFVCRCSNSSFMEAQDLLRSNRDGVSKRVRLFAPKHLRQKQSCPSLEVRFLTLRLSTGELEVLVTSLLDPERYPYQVFGDLYHQRWGIETYYHLLKSRLDLENFSGKSLESIYQDFHATLLLSNLETLITAPLSSELQELSRLRKYPVQINRAVSFHTLKSHIIELLHRDDPIEEVLLELRQLFLSNLISQRLNRKIPRKKLSPHRSWHFLRRIKKIVF